MKLRVRSLELNETLKIDVPSSCTLQLLKHRISRSFPSSSSSSSIHVSLNRKDELQGCDETLQSFGITSGDLVFLTSNPNGFSISTVPIHNSSPQIKIVTNLDTHEDKTLNLEEGSEEFMDVDETEMVVDVNLTKSFSIPGFLRKVFTEELSDDGGRDHKLLVVALHAVFLESGFVILDPVSLAASQIWKYWSLGVDASRMTLLYTLPELIHSTNAIHTVELKFQCLGKFFIAHGLLSAGVSTHTVTLNEDHLVPFLNETSPEREVFQFWRNAKDGLVLPLLIDLCDKAGFQLPPCFMRLPTDLKLKILELLPGVDIAKVSCVSSELRYLASSDDLWKEKYVEEFVYDDATSGLHWKDKFVETNKKRKLIVANPPWDSTILFDCLQY